MKKVILLIFIVLIHSLMGVIINVPADQTTIHGGITAAADGDTVLVQPGLYQETINFNGKDIVVGSLFLTTADSSYIATTIIDQVANDGYIVTFANNESSAAVLTGFTIGRNTFDTNGILCEVAEPQILNNHISVAGTWGIKCDGFFLSPYIEGNYIENPRRCIQVGGESQAVIANNHISLTDNMMSTGIMVFEAVPLITNNVIEGNMTYPSQGIHVFDDCPGVYIYNNRISSVSRGMEIDGFYGCEIVNNLVYNCDTGIVMTMVDGLCINNTVVNNISYGFYCAYFDSQRIINCISWGNHPNINTFASVGIYNSCFEGGIVMPEIDFGGNTSRYPCFIDEENNDYRLAAHSPCIDAGTAEIPDLEIPLFDIDGNFRIQDGIGDGALIPDMGCYEADTETNPAFITGRVSRTGGNGDIEDACIGVGAPVHPDESGNYLITTPVGEGTCNVTAWLENYLPETIEDVMLTGGQTVNGIDFELEYYQPEEYLAFSPDTLFFLTYDDICQDITMKNISLVDIYVSTVAFDSYDFMFENEFSQVLAPGDSLLCEIIMLIPMPDAGRELHYNTMFVFTDQGIFEVPLFWDSSLMGDAIDESLPVANLELTNYPNPFNPETMFSFALNEPGNVKLEIYNLKGQKVKTLCDGWKTESELNILWQGDDQAGMPVSTGIYFARLVYDGGSYCRKCILLK
ncbi:MAG: right-handed parallel beta-helix repeat-containing protein [Candidatus Stygibacter australis]|nr:right-handed parallel beta-helix repeat-containing protein [Candidatus Stygibacter australis]MDP8322277.1 right-handed parallel beta-helix repeat-containing protein [Candidatus Stygibacter australis]